MKGERWSVDQIKILRTNYSGMNYRDIGLLIGKTESAVRCKAQNLQIRRRAARAKTWSNAELWQLRRGYGNKDMTINALAKELGKTNKQVANMAYRMGIQKTGHYQLCLSIEPGTKLRRRLRRGEWEVFTVQKTMKLRQKHFLYSGAYHGINCTYWTYRGYTYIVTNDFQFLCKRPA